MLRKLFSHPLFYIVILALILRFYNLSSTPPSLNWDETSHGWNAYSILKTGKDEWGVSFPIIFRAFGDYKLPVYIYLTALSELVFGLTPFAVRLPSALAGVGIVIVTYLLVKEIFKKENLAVLSSFLVAIEPWSLFLSRGAFEANLALLFFVSAVYFFLNSIRTHSIINNLVSIIFFGLTVWTYNSYRIFTPPFLVLLIWFYKSELREILKKNKKSLVGSLIVICLFFLPMFVQLFQQSGQARLSVVGILDEAAIAKIEETRNISSLSPTFNRLINNRITYFTKVFVENWASHYSGDFLFFKGGSNYQYNVYGFGLLYKINLIGLILGILYLLKESLQYKHDNNRRRQFHILLFWFFVSPLASSFTHEAPHTLRAITMLPSPMIITAVGLVMTMEKLYGNSQKTFLSRIALSFPVVIYLLILSGLFFAYAKLYFVDYSKYNSFVWQYGYKEVVTYTKENYDRYDKIIMTKRYGEPHIFILFNWPWDPYKYQNDPSLNRFFQTNWYWVDGFDKFFFVNDWDISNNVDEVDRFVSDWEIVGSRRQEIGNNYDFILESNKTVDCNPSAISCLLITSPGTVPAGWNKLKTVNFLDGQKAFEIYDNK